MKVKSMTDLTTSAFKSRALAIFSLMALSFCFSQCKRDPMSVEASLENMQVEEGFEVKLVAAEPLISAPVAMTFDNRSRIWALEMNGFMPDTLGTGEDKPSGKVVILEDEDKDEDENEDEERGSIPVKSHLYTFPRMKLCFFPCALP